MKYYLSLPLALALLGTAATNTWTMMSEGEENRPIHHQHIFNLSLDDIEKMLKDKGWVMDHYSRTYKSIEVTKGKTLTYLYEMGGSPRIILKLSPVTYIYIFRYGDKYQKVYGKYEIKFSGVKQNISDHMQELLKPIRPDIVINGFQGKLKFSNDKEYDEVMHVLYPYLHELGMPDAEEMIALGLLPEDFLGDPPAIKELKNQIKLEVKEGHILGYLGTEGLVAIKKLPLDKYHDAFIVYLMERLQPMGFVEEKYGGTKEQAKRALSIMQQLLARITNATSPSYTQSRQIFADFITGLTDDVMPFEQRYHLLLQTLFEGKDNPDMRKMLERFTKAYLAQGKMKEVQNYNFAKLQHRTFEQFWNELHGTKYSDVLEVEGNIPTEQQLPRENITAPEGKSLQENITPGKKNPSSDIPFED